MDPNESQATDIGTFKAVEFLVNADRLDETGRAEFYAARDTDDAVSRCLNTHRLHNGQAFIGPSGRIVYCGHLAYTILQDG